MKTLISLVLICLIGIISADDFLIQTALINANTQLDQIKWDTQGKLMIRNLGMQAKKDAIVALENERVFHSNSEDCEDLLVRYVNTADKTTYVNTLPCKLFKNKAFNEFIEITINFEEKLIGINYGIANYIVKKEPKEPLTVRIVETLESQHMHYTTDEDVIREFKDQGTQGAANPPQPQEQSFLSKYFWYIVIFVVLFMFLGNIDKEKLNEAMQQAQNQAQQQRR